MSVAEVISRDGTPIVYSAEGRPGDRPLVLLHGWAQTSRCWGDEVVSALAQRYRVIAVDLRGHGYSGAPTSGYDESARWADDVDAVLAGEGIESGAVLLGWSYGGLVLCDYLAVNGTGAVDGIVLVGAITGIGRGYAGGRIGDAMRAAIPGAMSGDVRTAVRALGSFGTALTGAAEGVGEAGQQLFGASLSTRPRVRAAVFDRQVDHDDVLRGLDVPALVLHGTADSVVDVSAGRHAASLIPDASTSWWEGENHGPFVADPSRFVSEVSAFVDSLGETQRTPR